jgi:surface protein
MSLMFHNATSFNQPLSTWDVRQVTGMSEMFNGATSFNQRLDTWDVSHVVDVRGMFVGATLLQPSWKPQRRMDGPP